MIRGLGVLGQSMMLGMKALQFSANAALDDGSEAEAKPVSQWMMVAQAIFSVLFFIVLYKLVPLKLTDMLANALPVLKNQILFNAVDGIIRLSLFIGFLTLLSRTKDIKRVFEYHGAEHKVVFNFESGQEVNIANAQKFVTFHPRCGTSFMFVIMLISMVFYMFIPVQTFAAKLAIRIIFLPLIAGVSYELIRFAAKRQGSFLNLLTAPGLWTQRITTQPPSDEEVDIAVQALKGAMALESKQGGELVIA